MRCKSNKLVARRKKNIRKARCIQVFPSSLFNREKSIQGYRSHRTLCRDINGIAIDEEVRRGIAAYNS